MWCTALVTALRSVGEREGGVAEKAYRFCMSKMIFISFSTAAIFSADEGCWRLPPNPRKDMFVVNWWATVVCE